MNQKALSTLFIILLLSTTSCNSFRAEEKTANTPSLEDQKRLEELLHWVFETMNTHYFEEISLEKYDLFRKKYTTKYLHQLNTLKPQTDDYVHLGAGLLVNTLKNKKDRFSNFVPPKKAEAFKQDAYSAKVDLGIEGTKTRDGFEILKVEKHTDAFMLGIRPGDMLYKINGESVISLSQERIQELLKPEVGTLTNIEIYTALSGQTQWIELESKSYFAETIFSLDFPFPDVLALQIKKFNQKTPGDFADIVKDFGPNRIRHLVLDLRGNTGGPPLATRDIMGYLRPPKEVLFFIVRKNQKPFLLITPESKTLYDGPMTVLVDGKTASAAETLSGILQMKQLANIVGQQTAGASFLKSIYDYEDGSSVMLVTSKTFFHNGKVFPINGITPDILLQPNEDALDYVMKNMRP